MNERHGARVGSVSARRGAGVRWRLNLVSVVTLVATVGVQATGVHPAGAAAPTISAMSAGFLHTCVLTTSGGVKCWGYNEMGQLGDGTTTDRRTPVDVVGLTSGVTAIGGGGNHTCALTTAGGMKCWGANGFGQAGDDTLIDRPTPVDVIGLTSGVVGIAVGAFHTCAVVTGGGARCWGLNDFGQLGDGSWSTRKTPVNVSQLNSGVAALSTGGRHTCALTAAGGAKCWGRNLHGQLGDGGGGDNTHPVDVMGLTAGVASVTAGGRHTCALTNAGGAKCWGRNDFGQVGDGTGGDLFSPVDVVGLTSGVAGILAGRYHTCAITSPGGGVKCWGSIDGSGSVGDTAVLTPQDVPGLSGITALAAGEGHTCGLTSSAGVKCWGRNDVGQLGDGTLTASLNPVDVVFAGAPLTGTATSLTSTPNPSLVGQAVTFTAVVTPSSGTGTPTGTVSFREGGTTLGTGTVSAGTATFTTSSLSAGVHALTAVYSGDGAFAGSTSPGLAQTVEVDTGAGPVTIVVGDVAVVEGNSGTRPAIFTVSLSRASTSKVSVRVETRNGTATDPSDYRGLRTTVSFSPGVTSKTVLVSVKGDLVAEADETFTIALSKPVNATITDATGVGTIVNDD